MSISFGPFKSTVPLVSVEEVLISSAQQATVSTGAIMRTDNQKDDGTLDITVQLSNEIVLEPPPQVKVGNWIYFTYNKEEADTLVQNPKEAKKSIRSMDQLSGLTVKLVLDEAEFEITDMQVSFRHDDQFSTLPIRSNKIRRTLRIPAGDLKYADLYMVVASFSEYKNIITLGNIAHHTILEEGRVPEEAYLYKLTQSVPSFGLEDTIWPGPVHIYQDILMAGQQHKDEGDHPRLTKVPVPNIKVKDMRILTMVQKTSPSYVPPNRARPYISPLEVSRRDNEVVNGMFSFDLSAYISTNSSLNGIMTNTQSLLSSVEIKDIIIHQRQTGLAARGNSQTPTAISYCGIDATRGFHPVASLGNGCEILNTLDNGNSILNVSFVDTTLFNDGPGAAEYKVEILLVDRAIEVVEDITTQLNNMVSQAVNRLTLRRERGSPQLYARAIATYLNLIEFLFGNVEQTFSLYTKDYWRMNMLAMMYGPQVGDQEKMQLMTAIDGFIQQLNTLVQKAPMATVTTANYRSKIGSSNSQSLLTYHHGFGEKLYLQPPKTGLEYIDRSLSSPIAAIPQISYNNYTSRAQSELDKYGIDSPSAANVNQYGFLSPSAVRLGPGHRVQTTDLELSNTPLLPLMQSALNTDISLNASKQENPAVQSLNILRSAGIAVLPLKVPLKKEVISPDVVNPPLVAASDYLSSNSSFYLANLSGSEVSGSQRSIIRSSAREALITSPLVATLVDQTMLNFVPTKTMANTDTLGGSVAVIKNNETEGQVLVNSTAMTAATNFGSLVGVQYLSAYDPDMGVMQQNWKTLDKVTFEDARDANRPLICRLRKITNTITLNPIIQLDPMATYFVLGPITVRSSTLLPVPTLAPPQNFGKAYVDRLTALGTEILYSDNGTVLDVEEGSKAFEGA
jgi:hypothetical protein